MMSTIPTKIVPKIGALIRMLASDQDGEALGAARALDRTLHGVGLDLNDLAASVEGQPRRPRAPRAPRAPRTQPAPPQAPQSTGMTWSLDKRITVARTLRRGISEDVFTEWEVRFAIDIIAAVASPSRPRNLSPKQVEVVNRLLTKVEERAR